MTAAARPRAISTLIWYLTPSYHLIYFRSFNLCRAWNANCPNYAKVGERLLQPVRVSELERHLPRDLLLPHRGDATGPGARSIDRSGKQTGIFFMCGFHFFSPFSIFFSFSTPPAPPSGPVLSSCWQQQTLYFDELINISPGREGAPACSASPCFTSE